MLDLFGNDTESNLNVRRRDVDSVETGFGKHERVVVFQPDIEGVYCRIDCTQGLPIPTEEQLLKVMRAFPNDITGSWRLKEPITARKYRTSGSKFDSYDVIFLRNN